MKRFQFSIKFLFLFTLLVGLLLCISRYPVVAAMIGLILFINSIGLLIGFFMNTVLKMPTDGGHWSEEIRREKSKDAPEYDS